MSCLILVGREPTPFEILVSITGSKIPVWNIARPLVLFSGDAKYTEMGRKRAEHSVGQLCRQRFGIEKVFNLGFR
jgi:hypothetical protein